jgi:hypothetical protein
MAKKQNNKKQYYQNLITRHKSTLAKARGLIETLLDKLETEINNPSAETNHFLFGEKESASAIVVKLTNVLLKLIPLEQEIARADLSKADLSELEELSVKTQLPQEDMELIERYIEKYNESKE